MLDLLVEGGDALTMSAVARRASCSKETLYKWFGDREGLLTATVRWQASKVGPAAIDARAARRVGAAGEPRGVRGQLARGHLLATSIALNRVAMGHAESRQGATWAQIVLANGRFAIGERLKPLLEAARDAGLLEIRRYRDGVPHLLRSGRAATCRSGCCSATGCG